MACVAMASTFGRCTIRVNSTTFYPGDVIRAGSGGETVVFHRASHRRLQQTYPRDCLYEVVNSSSGIRYVCLSNKTKDTRQSQVFTYYDTG